MMIFNLSEFVITFGKDLLEIFLIFCFVYFFTAPIGYGSGSNRCLTQTWIQICIIMITDPKRSLVKGPSMRKKIY